jgi:hypothetical protein
MMAGAELQRISAALSAARQEPVKPRDWAAFFRHESDGGLHCAVKVYFAPGAAPVAQAFGAVPCRPPTPDGLGLLAGCENAKPPAREPVKERRP